MNKNQIVGMIILIAFIFVAIFLYVVFRANKQEVSEDMINSESGVAVDVENDVTLDSFLNDDIDTTENMEVIAEISNEEIITKPEVITESVAIKEVKTSPETGPGANAVALALLASVIISAFVFKIQGSEK